MASSKERARWERWYDQVTARMERQKQSISRLVLINTETVAALHEIAAMPDEYDDNDQAAARAREALDRIGASAAAGMVTEEESEGAGEDIIDPRRSNRNED